MALGMGTLGYSEDRFWETSLQGLFAALEGWGEANGAKPKHPQGTREKLMALGERYSEPSRSIRKSAR